MGTHSINSDGALRSSRYTRGAGELRAILLILGAIVSLESCGSRAGLDEVLPPRDRVFTREGGGRTSADAEVGIGNSESDSASGARDAGHPDSFLADAFRDPVGKPWLSESASPLNWRSSLQPYCTGAGFVTSLDLWSDDRGVYVLEESSAEQIQVNYGEGWQNIFQSPTRHTTPVKLTGLPNGPLFTFGSVTCAIQEIADGTSRCASAASAAQGVFFVRKDIGYAVEADRLYRYDGRLWTQRGQALPLRSGDFAALWAAEDVIAIASTAGGMVLRPVDPQPTLVINEPLEAVWGFASDDLWFAAKARISHWNGHAIDAGVEARTCGAIRGLWG
ncbi:MAG TPA: hypothetical protein VJT73_12130, partial [Polyangiaceae bacterium]|nr:hypothetical protein [Polyangiaceae bacterium]